MAGRVYRLPLAAVSLSTVVQDIFVLQSTSSMACVVEEIRLDPNATSVSEFSLTLKRFSGAYTVTGGTSITPAKTNFGDPAAICTATRSNTTQTTGGTSVTVDGGSWNLVNGWLWVPTDPDHRVILAPSQAFVLSLDTVPASQTVSGCLIFREIF